MVLVDSSVWIEYFKGNVAALPLDALIDANALCVNDLILAELLPSIVHKKEDHLLGILLTVSKTNLQIDWNRIIQMQTLNLRNGMNRIGLSDLIIAQDAINNEIELFSMDTHFSLLSELHGIRLYGK